MVSGATDLFCGACGAYAHAFLDACPFCGGPRTSRLEEASGDPAEFRRALTSDAELRASADQLARTTALRTALQSGIGGALGETPDVANEAEPDLGELVTLLTERMRYRAWPAAAGGSGPVGDVRLRLESTRLLLSKERAPVAEVPLALVLGIGCASDRVEAPAPARPPLVQVPDRKQGQEVAIGHATPDGIARVAFGNPSGLFATKARPDHYATVAWWLGVAAALASARRWEEIGVAEHAAELGIAAPSAR